MLSSHRKWERLEDKRDLSSQLIADLDWLRYELWQLYRPIVELISLPMMD